MSKHIDYDPDDVDGGGDDDGFYDDGGGDLDAGYGSGNRAKFSYFKLIQANFYRWFSSW